MKIDAPKLVRPGDTLTIGYQTTGPAKLVLIAVDEGILQVARYHTPDPLSYFFRKRALEVTTWQILDLVLPELHLLNESSAPGGDEEGLMARSHNPFKRKGQKPVAFWSGIIESDGKPGHLDVPIPDYFNGTVRVMAIAVSDGAIGVAENKVVSQGYFVIQPQAPYFAAPGDVFEITALVANNIASSPNNSKVKVKIDTSAALEVVGDKTINTTISPGSDTTVHFLVRAKPILGDATMTFAVSRGKARELHPGHERPACFAICHDDQFGVRQKVAVQKRQGRRALDRKMYPDMRTIEVSASSFPLGLARAHPLSCDLSLRMHRTAGEPGVPGGRSSARVPNSDLPATSPQRLSRAHSPRWRRARTPTAHSGCGPRARTFSPSSMRTRRTSCSKRASTASRCRRCCCRARWPR